LILIEFELHPRADGKTASELSRTGHASGLPGWFALWDVYMGCLRERHIDVDVPKRLKKLLAASGEFHKIVTDDVNIPIGFFPKGTFVHLATSFCNSVCSRPSHLDDWTTGMDGLRPSTPGNEATYVILRNSVVEG
jgi:hypothetical protein